MNETFYSGYMPIRKHETEYLFFVMYESRNDPETDPIIVWLQGECSSGIGMWLENGPLKIAFNLTGRPVFNLTRNNNSWTNNATVVYLDFPIGNGFSFGSQITSYRILDIQLQEDFYLFMKGLIEVFPQYRRRPFVIAGEGLAGQLIPKLANYIIEQVLMIDYYDRL
jgi:cathepsin A (carboxypeptidase C)